MGLSFQEKSLWLQFVSLIAVFGLYFSTVLPTDTMIVLPHQVGLFVGMVVLLVILMVTGHILIAIIDRRTGTDERDQLFELKGERNSSYVLATGVFLSLCAAVFVEGNFVFTHLLLGFWVLAQLIEIGSQLYFYRRGA
jgi:cytochrome b subunit of formate dehydrogenase